jgi:hypothetical protein
MEEITKDGVVGEVKLVNDVYQFVPKNCKHKKAIP